MSYTLFYDETMQVVEHYSIYLDEVNHADFIAAHRDLIDKAMSGDAQAKHELWEAAQEDGFIDSYDDREITDYVDTYFDIKEEL